MNNNQELEDLDEPILDSPELELEEGIPSENDQQDPALEDESEDEGIPSESDTKDQALENDEDTALENEIEDISSERLQIDFDSDKYYRRSMAVTTVAGRLRKVNQILKVMGVSFQIKDLQQILTDPSGFIFEREIGNSSTITVGNLKIERSKAIDLLEKPPYYNELLQAVDLVIELRSSKDSLTLEQILDAVTFDEKREIIVNPEYEKMIEESCKIHAQTEQCKTVFAFANDLVTLLKERNIHDLFVGNRNISRMNFTGFLNSIVTFDDRQKDYVISKAIIRRFNR